MGLHGRVRGYISFPRFKNVESNNDNSSIIVIGFSSSLHDFVCVVTYFQIFCGERIKYELIIILFCTSSIFWMITRGMSNI
jgi:hypothetical protein